MCRTGMRFFVPQELQRRRIVPLILILNSTQNAFGVETYTMGETGGFIEKALVCPCLLRFWHTLGLGLATIPGTAADWRLSGDRLTETVAQGGSEAAVATCGHR